MLSVMLTVVTPLPGDLLEPTGHAVLAHLVVLANLLSLRTMLCSDQGAKQRVMTVHCWQEPGAAAVQAAKLAELCHSDGRLEAAEALYERSGHGRKALQMWLGGGQWSQAHAAAVRQKLTQQQMQVMGLLGPARTVPAHYHAADLHPAPSTMLHASTIRSGMCREAAFEHPWYKSRQLPLCKKQAICA